MFTLSCSRINIGLRYQAPVPELRERSAAQHDLHKADVVWALLPDLEANTKQQQRGLQLTQYHITFSFFSSLHWMKGSCRKMFCNSALFKWNLHDHMFKSVFPGPSVCPCSGWPHAPGVLECVAWRRDQSGTGHALPIWMQGWRHGECHAVAHWHILSALPAVLCTNQTCLCPTAPFLVLLISESDRWRVCHMSRLYLNEQFVFESSKDLWWHLWPEISD